MTEYNKDEIKKELTLDNIFELLQEWGGDPEFTNSGIVSTTICHNLPGQGSRKLYFYKNTGLFKCFTGCENDTFDIFELCIKVMSNQKQLDWDLNMAIRYIANQFGISGSSADFSLLNELEDWTILRNYDNIHQIKTNPYKYSFTEYDDTILQRFNYDVAIKPWLDEGISIDTMRRARIGYYPGGEQITIPHYDINGKFIGLRGRALGAQEAERYGKYVPIRVNNVLYSHPLGMNLYGLNWAKDNIKRVKTAIVVEGEKSVLKGIDYMQDNNIVVACCGSNLSAYQAALLLNCGVEEICIGFDKQFKEIDDDEFKKLTKSLTKIHNKYSKYCLISFMFDKNNLLDYKDSPVDKGQDTFFRMFKERIIW